MSDQPLAVWKWGIQPNTVIVILITISKSAQLVPIVECLGQLKWVHFEGEPRALSHMETFNNAARGPWGSLKLLLQLGLRERFPPCLASLGATLTIFLLAFEPFTQQIMKISVRNRALSDFVGIAPLVAGLPNSAVDYLKSGEEAVSFGYIMRGLRMGRPSVVPSYAHCPTQKCD
ncbi:hypothetical protein K458DRAFT_341263, partial [Lentithecium fluviatile CBS 122367]